MGKPKVFVGSSTEGLSVAQAIQVELRDDAEVTVWNQGCFGLGESTLESLVLALEEFDFAILVVRGDDKTVTRKRSMPSTRDNVLFELGLFMGHLGRDRTFIFYDTSNPPKIIGDLKGITFAAYAGSDRNLQRAVGPGCTLIRREIIKHSTPKEVWYTEFRFGKKTYRETLNLFQIAPTILGSKDYEEVGGKTTTFALQGFRGKGFDWLEYHTEDGNGGGAILLRQQGTGVARGLIIAGHCDTGAMRCYENRWAIKGSRQYDLKWLRPIAENIL